ncbi:TetR/AcrR family transcriptional regulator [Amycolatopsis balhimycina DSM 5908]|uniref:TetR/AcrR family transcriptional regulator n=1 Tax=Amycolatopsis balhimycina DSM 5908 TaxID=1081091 RepID=A0A428WCZ4_AMYBA|nr:helix-turn-helix domain-containing protein [Amycolatopsis balhimycina]RSM40940.1 TetR/AcrR family transcriptional regulator [Amycolatopsis balhimycina DSM 5908]
MNSTEATSRLLEAAEDLFYAHGVQAVGMDAVRERSGVSLKRLYQCFPAKNDLVEAYLLRRDERWRGSLREFVHARGDDPLAVFDWLRSWFAEPGFRGCAFVNSFGEFGEPAPGIAIAIRKHKDEVRAYLRGLVPGQNLADQLFSLMEGATVLAAITGDPGEADTAREAAKVLLAAQG